MIEKKQYTLANLNRMETTPEMIISRALDDEIRKRMEIIIEAEAPIREQLLFKRTINSFGMQKVGSRILPVFKEIENSLKYDSTIEGGETVFHINEENYFRPTPDSSVRYSYQIPYTEGANCILYILENGCANSYSKKEMKALFMKELEYLKFGAKVEDLFKNALKDERIKISGNGRILR